MTLEEFKKTILKDVEAFERQWEAGRKADPEAWPISMSEGDWFDQFLSFQTES